MTIWRTFLLLMLVWTGTAAAQDGENSAIVGMIEDGLSNPDRQIRLVGIEGLLASEATVEAITVADRQGVWLTVNGAKIVWSRLALLRGRLSIDELTADSIEVTRRPVAGPPGLPSPEARAFTVPELPLSVNIGKLAIARIVLAPEILGQAAELAVEGSLSLAGGGMEADFRTERLDVAGARIALGASYTPGGAAVSVDLVATEPANGLLANMLAIPNRPALDLTLKGAGPVNDLKLDLNLLANQLRQVQGTITLDDAPGGLGFDVDLAGRLAFLVTGEIREFFKGESTLRIAGRQLAGGGVELGQLAVKTASLSLTGNLQTAPDGFLRRAELNGQLGDGVSQTVLPFGQGISVREARLVLDYGIDGADVWTGALAGTALIAGDLSAAEFGLDFGGLAQNLDDADKRLVTLTSEGGFRGLRGATADMTRALGQALDIRLVSRWQSGQPFRIEEARIDGNGTSINLNGEWSDLTFTGAASVNVDRLAPFAGLAGRDLRGALALAVEGSVAPLTGAFDLAVDGTSSSLILDIAQLDALMAGETALSGRVARDETGFRTSDLRLKNAQLDFSSDGSVASDSADLTFIAVINELADLTQRANGQLRLEGRANGEGGKIALASAIVVNEGAVLDRPLTGLRAGFTGTLQDGALDGLLIGSGRFGDGAIALVGQVAADRAEQSLSDFEFRVGPSSVSGTLVQRGGLLDGNLAVDAPDISDLAALALTEATGTVRAQVAFAPNALGQQITVSGGITDLVLPQGSVGSADLRVIVQNAFGVPTVLGTANFGRAEAGGIALRRGRANAVVDGQRTAFDAAFDLVNGTAIALDGTLAPRPEGYELALAKLTLDGAGPDILLAHPAALLVTSDSVTVETLDLSVGDGRISARGMAGETLDLALDLTSVPLAVGNAVVDDLGAEGTLTAAARITGTPAEPIVVFDARAADVSTRLLRAADLPPFALDLSGQSENGGLRVGAKLDGPSNFDATLVGYVPLDNTEMDLDGNLTRFPLALIDALAGQPGLRGTVNGTFGIAGRFARPRLRFDLSGDGITARIARENGIPPVSATASGSFVNDTITLPDARITGAGGIDVRLSGRIPLRLDGLDMAGSGTAPLGIANVAMARSGIRAQGNVDLGLRATGRLAAPVLQGRANIAGATVTASKINLRLEDLAAQLDLNGDRITVRSISARNSRGGRIEGAGTVSASARDGMPADIALRLLRLDYTDAKLLATTIDGTLSLTGPLMRRPFLKGDLTLAPLEITIPSRLPQSSGFSLEVRHVNAPAGVARTLQRATTNLPTDDPEQADGAVRLDITVRAPNRVFVRGRGLDAELGGQVRVTGTLPNYKPNGRFDLIRGRLALLGQRINLTSGAIILTGTNIPDLQMEARVVTDEIEATFFMEGPASAPELRFSSVPDLPDDEILARVLFGRAISELSPLQVARLAAAVGELSGRTGGGIFEQIRQATGLDDLDFQTREDGSTSIQAGKYIQDNVYSTIEADSLGNSRATINLDINDNITARGSVGSDGNTTIGIFFEKDY